MSQPANPIAFWQAARDAALGRAAEALCDDNPRHNSQQRREAAHLQATIADGAAAIAREPEQFESLRAAKVAAWERMRAARTTISTSVGLDLNRTMLHLVTWSGSNPAAVAIAARPPRLPANAEIGAAGDPSP